MDGHEIPLYVIIEGRKKEKVGDFEVGKLKNVEGNGIRQKLTIG